MSSLSSWRAWIEICRGVVHGRPSKSLSSWRAWIEIHHNGGPSARTERRSPHGERGLKLWPRVGSMAIGGRSPHGERGLKFKTQVLRDRNTRSLSSWRAWIEIMTSAVTASASSGRSPHGERGLKFFSYPNSQSVSLSLSSWRAWIEMP